MPSPAYIAGTNAFQPYTPRRPPLIRTRPRGEPPFTPLGTSASASASRGTASPLPTLSLPATLTPPRHRPSLFPTRPIDVRPRSSSTSLHSLSNAVGLATGAAEAAAGAAAQTAATATQAAGKVASATVTKGGAPFWQLLLAFTLGGLFFSTVAASITAAYAFGIDNCLRVWSLVREVMGRVWSVLWDFVCVAKDVLFGDYDGAANRFVDAWRTLLRGFGEARRVAAEGVQAIRQEGRLYAAAVGTPGLIPVQYALDRLTSTTLAGVMEKALRDALAGAAGDPKSKVRRVTLKRFNAGTVSPRLKGARLYDLGTEDLAFDIDVIWQSNLEADVSLVTRTIGAKIPVSVRNLRFEGPVRAIVVRLRKDEPGFGAILISLTAPPRIAMDIKVAGGEVTRVPWLRSEITRTMQDAIKNEALWPRRVVVPAEAVPPLAVAGVGKRPVLSAAQLNELHGDDPLLRAERQLRETRPEYLSQLAAERTDPNSSSGELAISMDATREIRGGLEGNGVGGQGGEEDDVPWWRRATKRVSRFQRKLATSNSQ